ncbi:hypothetical protein B566_EDAN017366 [Ephemera danica]|nr:hypothetical protein B566_EDAN017366 [Ephemera danica]
MTLFCVEFFKKTSIGQSGGEFSFGVMGTFSTMRIKDRLLPDSADRVGVSCLSFCLSDSGPTLIHVSHFQFEIFCPLQDPSNPGPCSDIYPGSEAFSEPEVQAMADFLTANPQITSYLTIHAYGTMLMYPWGWTNALPPQAPELDALANDAANALSAVDGTTYDVGSIANVIYLAYGGSVDWTMGGINLIDSFAFELPGGGLQGFNPPADRIMPVCLETWEAYKVFAANIPASRG